ncbi:hypothetical protein ABT56_20220 [Photobacterium aquae]|uniref:Uncharacterized protein n=1 Tax=Photobacterium aquae TaxID=1195763 RepID=A0A0J1JME0_9GAMM|nr:hypothetical protein [Photobacterium aquae]KLV03297.1 hypothetical protein ABT56_20220 [Photobacterium aquae]
MGRKAREKRLNKFWEQCQTDAKNATEAEKKQAASIFADLSKEHPVKRSEQFGRALNRVFDDFGDTLGGLVMVEFAKSEGVYRT